MQQKSMDDIIAEWEVEQTLPDETTEAEMRLRQEAAIRATLSAPTAIGGDTVSEFEENEYEDDRLCQADADHQTFAERLSRGDLVPFADLPEPIPEEANRNGLFEGGWLRKGGAAMLVSIAGSGKSVIAMQMMCCWAAGRPAFDIAPLKALKIGYVQAEDDSEDLAEHRNGVLRGLRDREQWSDAEFAEAQKNIMFIPPFVAEPGEKFVRYLAAVQRKVHFDLIVINPLQSFSGCDLQSNAEVTKFVRNGLDRVIKNPETNCGLFIIHHTPKPPLDARVRANFGLDAFGEYVGAGASELTNWVRAMLTLIPVPKHRGIFYLAGVKREDRLQWPEPQSSVGQKPRLVIAHTKGYLYWQTLTQVPKTESEEGGDRPEVEIHAEALAKVVLASRHKEMQSTELRETARKLIKSKKLVKMTYKQIVEAIKLLLGHAEDYGLELVNGDHNAKFLRKFQSPEVAQSEALDGYES